MSGVLELLNIAVDGVVAVDIALLGVEELGPSILCLQREMDRLRVTQSRL